MLGWTEADVARRSMFDFVHPNEVEKTQKALRRAARGETVPELENRCTTYDEGYRWLEWNFIPASGELVYATARDITNRKRAEREQGEQTRLLLLAEEVARIGHWRIDLTTSGLTWSDEVYRMLGLERETFNPTLENWIELFHPEDREAVAKHLQEAIDSHQSFEFELRVVRADGAVRSVVARGLAEVEQERPVAVFGVFQDVTERKALQERVLQSERMASVGTLAAGVAHEINNPLTYVLHNVRLVSLALERLEYLSDELGELRGMLEEAWDGAERVRKIVRGLKTFSRTDSETRMDVDVRLPLDAAIEIAGNEIRHRARLFRQFDETPPLVANESQLTQVFVNLLVNAAQALPAGGVEGGRIIARTRTDETGRAVIEIEDNGPGMAPDVVRRAFDPFFTTKPVGVGTGLGLSICRNIITSMGGDIEIDSFEGRGTTVRVALPPSCVEEAEAPTQPDVEGAEKPSRTRRGRVLVVDDDPMVGKAMLRMLGPTVDARWVGEARKALKVLQDHPHYDAVVCDLMMPDMTGMDFHRSLVEAGSPLADRIIFVTGGAFTEAARRFLRDTQAPHLDKPFRPEELTAALQPLLEVGDRATTVGDRGPNPTYLPS